CARGSNYAMDYW
nr:immunoglobulin heavy chain junction region [Mus musculus]MBK4198475.1 immunoglobulin heavy chain junction region [Mus musculus]MBK4198476.1 immunoglobulin heavy chain junction region [Mus musculus]MBK4198477.1 immunoglobulin heavy chain junction region [Mus musculus]MBK4198479.1 immunoglobulin heavy chain junction region [Mus musculus]